MNRRLMAALVVAGLALGVPSGAPAHERSTDTYLVETGSGRLEITPGLCAVGDTPECVGPHRAQFRVAFDTCTIAGRFEGKDLPSNPTCGGINHGFTQSSAQGWWKPACGSTRSETSPNTTAWWPETQNTHTINGVVRQETFIVIQNAGGALLISGWIDDDDADLDPVGDHQFIALVNVRPVSPEGKQACYTAPAQHFTFTSLGWIQ